MNNLLPLIPGNENSPFLAVQCLGWKSPVVLDQAVLPLNDPEGEVEAEQGQLPWSVHPCPALAPSGAPREHPWDEAEIAAIPFQRTWDG